LRRQPEALLGVFTIGSIRVRQIRSADRLGTRAIPARTTKISKTNSKQFMIILLV